MPAKHRLTVKKLQETVEEEKEESIKEVSIDEIVPMAESEAIEDLAGENLIGPVKVKDRLLNWWSRVRPLREQDIRIEGGDTQKRKKWAVLMGVVFLILLSFSPLCSAFRSYLLCSFLC